MALHFSSKQGAGTVAPVIENIQWVGLNGLVGAQVQAQVHGCRCTVEGQVGASRSSL